MNLIAEEQSLIEDTAEIAWALVCAGKHKAVRSKLRRIAKSFCVVESTQVCVILEAEMFSREGKQEEAEDLIRRNISYLWGNTDALNILNRRHQAVDADTKEYHIEIQGGQAALGGFTTFSDDHIASFDVLANDEPEAMGYIEQVCHFLVPEGKKLLGCTKKDVEPDVFEHRGVVMTYPFRT